MTTAEIKEQLNSLQEQINNLTAALQNYATTDDLVTLTDQVKTVQQNTSTLQNSVAELTTAVNKISTIYGLLDFELDDQNTPLTNGDILQYDNGKWHNISLTQLGIIGNSGITPTSLAALSDVILTSPTNNQVLVFNGASEKWINKEISSGSGNTSDYLTKALADATYFKIAGGTITGDVIMNGDLLVKQNIRAEGNIYAEGAITAKDIL